MNSAAATQVCQTAWNCHNDSPSQGRSLRKMVSWQMMPTPRTMPLNRQSNQARKPQLAWSFGKRLHSQLNHTGKYLARIVTTPAQMKNTMWPIITSFVLKSHLYTDCYKPYLYIHKKMETLKTVGIFLFFTRREQSYRYSGDDYGYEEERPGHC